MIKHLKWVGSGIAHLFYPMHCAGCDNELNGTEKILCLHCMTNLPKTGLHNKESNIAFQKFIGRVPIENATSFVYFTKQGLVQHLLHQFKYKGKAEIGIFLGNVFAEDLEKSGWMRNIDAIVPVPLHVKKEQQRGFNQSRFFAQGIAEICGKPLWDDVLKRIINTDSQTHKSRAERVENMKDVFECQKPNKIANKHLLLVDDVLTTGATLEACALSLLKNNNVKVSIATLAIATD